jgi:hypothetical protein
MSDLVTCLEGSEAVFLSITMDLAASVAACTLMYHNYWNGTGKAIMIMLPHVGP